MKRIFFPNLCAVLVFTLMACNQKVDKGDDKLTEGLQQVDVHYKDSILPVYFDNLKTSYPVDPDTPVVYIKDIAMGSGLVANPEGVWLNFVGEDGYHPIGGFCSGYAPVPWNLASQGYIERGTARLIWPDSLGFPQCLFVRDVVMVEIADDPEDLPLCGDTCWTKGGSGGTGDAGADSDLENPLPLDIVNVHYLDKEYSVDATVLATTTINGDTVVTLAAIIEAANLGVSLDGLTIDVKGNDNWPPDGTCPDLPAPSAWADKIGITTATATLVWDTSLGADCHIRLMNGGHIYLAAE